MCIRDRSYIGYNTRKIQKCFRKYNIEVAVKKSKTVFDIIKTTNFEEDDILKKRGVYMLSCRAVSYTHLDVYKRQHIYRLCLYSGIFII